MSKTLLLRTGTTYFFAFYRKKNAVHGSFYTTCRQWLYSAV